MLVREVLTDAKTGEVTERMVEIPDVLTLDQGMAATAAAAQSDANRLTIQQKADQFMSDSAAFLALASPTNAQVLAQVRQNTRALRALVRLVRGRFDATD